MAKGRKSEGKKRGPGRGQRVKHRTPAGTFTVYAPYIESVIEIVEESPEKFPHLQSSAKALLELLWRGLDPDRLENKEQETLHGLLNFSQPSQLNHSLIPAEWPFWEYFAHHAELVFELCARVVRWKSLKGPDLRTNLHRFMIMNPAIDTGHGIALLHTNISGIGRFATTEEILTAFKRQTGKSLDSKTLAEVRHHKLRERRYRKSLEDRTRRLGIDC